VPSIRNPEVLVVGAGPVGLLSALALTERGVRVEVLDKEPCTAARSYALALHPRTLEILDEAGLASTLIAKGWRVETLGVYDDVGLRAKLDLGLLSSRFPFVLVVPQSELESTLQERLQAKGVEVKWNHRVSGLHVSNSSASVTVDKLEDATSGYAVIPTERDVVESSSTEARFVVGADGHRSVVRKALGISFDSRGDAELYAVVEFDLEEGPGHEMRVIFRDSAKSALWALGQHRCRWSFQLDSTEALDSRFKSRLAVRFREETLPHIAGDFLRQIVGTRAPWYRPEMVGVDWCTIVQFERRLARKFGRENVWLAGDAAHLTGPIGVQSMNLGLLEAYELATRMARILREDAPASLLAEYGRERLLDWHMLLSGDEGVSATDDADAWVAKHRGRFLDCLPASGEELTKLLQQVGLRPF